MQRILITLTLMFSTSALACNEQRPPKQFDHKPAVPYTIVRLPESMIDHICNLVMIKQHMPTTDAGYYGCTDLTTREVYTIAGGLGCVSEKAIIKHEVGHLNGWRHR